MKVLLKVDVKSVGKAGDLVNAKDGYARNFLMPRKWAMEATTAAVTEIERRNALERAKEAARRKEAEDLANQLKSKVINLEAKGGEKGKLYGSVTGQEIADALCSQHSIQLDKRKIELAEPIRNAGDSEVTVSLYAGVKVQMTVRVTAIR